ncbi:MAG TPA: hypothetical protein VGB48_10095 [Allosphingosinicella sp.]|jgi:uncharacterized protein (DUF58 family)
MLLALLLLQAATAQTAPDIELSIRARAKSVEIERKGEAKLQVTAEPDAGSRVEARVEPLPEGRTSLRNVEVNVRAEARVGEGVEIGAEAETARPQ